MGSHGFVGPCGNRNNPWVVGEGPGPDEAMGISVTRRVGQFLKRIWKWEPFVGASGRMLTHALKVIGVTRDAIYITNATKCQPPRNASPADWSQAIAHCSRSFLAKEAAGAAPSSVVTFGAKALEAVAGVSYCDGNPPAIFHWRGSLWYADEIGARMDRPGAFGQTLPALRFVNNPRILPTIHPAFIMRGMWKWQRVWLRDLWRGFHRVPVRPLPLSLPLPTDRVMVDLETLMEDATTVTLFGLSIDGKVVQEAIATPAIQTALKSPLPKCGHNITGFDLTVLDMNFLEHCGPYWDTISLARMDDSDLPVALDETCSRRLDDYVQWKGSVDSPGLFNLLCRIYDVPAGWRDNPMGRLLLYNKIDVINESNLLDSLRVAVGPKGWECWLKEHVACVEVRRDLYNRGMVFDIERGRARYEKFMDSLAQIAAEIMELVDPLWEARLHEPQERINRAETMMEEVAKKGATFICSLHPDYSGWRAPKSKKAGCQCRTVYETRANDRLSFKRMSKELTQLRKETRDLGVGFNPDSPDDWRWLFFEAKDYGRIAKATRQQPEGAPSTLGDDGLWHWFVRRPGLARTPSGVESIDDDNLAELRRQLQNEGTNDPVIELRLRYAEIQKLISTYLVPFLSIEGVKNSGRSLGVDNRAHPQYMDWKTNSGRWNSGSQRGSE